MSTSRNGELLLKNTKKMSQIFSICLVKTCFLLSMEYFFTGPEHNFSWCIRLFWEGFHSLNKLRNPFQCRRLQYPPDKGLWRNFQIIHQEIIWCKMFNSFHDTSTKICPFQVWRCWVKTDVCWISTITKRFLQRNYINPGNRLQQVFSIDLAKSKPWSRWVRIEVPLNIHCFSIQSIKNDMIKSKCPSGSISFLQRYSQKMGQWNKIDFTIL